MSERRMEVLRSAANNNATRSMFFRSRYAVPAQISPRPTVKLAKKELAKMKREREFIRPFDKALPDTMTDIVDNLDSLNFTQRIMVEPWAVAYLRDFSPTYDSPLGSDGERLDFEWFVADLAARAWHPCYDNKMCKDRYEGKNDRTRYYKDMAEYSLKKDVTIFGEQQLILWADFQRAIFKILMRHSQMDPVKLDIPAALWDALQPYWWDNVMTARIIEKLVIRWRTQHLEGSKAESVPIDFTRYSKRLSEEDFAFLRNIPVLGCHHLVGSWLPSVEKDNAKAQEDDQGADEE